MEPINIDTIKNLVKNGKLRWTNHLVIRLLQRNITQSDIELALLNGEIIEQYANDYPFPSCLVYGINTKNEIIHIVCGSNGAELWLITAYFPDDTEWEDDKRTRKEIK